MKATDADQATTKRFLSSLDHKQRYVLMLHYAEELTTAEIGVVLDLAANEVTHILNRLRADARRVFGLPNPVSA